jgi:3-methyl-2-oxobutanoate hydroxymethyltransferase
MEQVTVAGVREWRRQRPGEIPLAVTAYDHPMARLLDGCGIDILHVGDTLGMTVLGLPDTTQVTLADMVHHVKAVARGKRRALATADLPIHTYDTPDDAVRSARALMEAGADAVKMEGGHAIKGQIQAVLAAGIPVQGHLGMLPQHVLEEGGYRKKGKTREEAERLSEEARMLEGLGVFSIVLEAVETGLAGRITDALGIPTFGIASGPGTTGQIRVLQDVLGLTPWFRFPHIIAEVDGAGMVEQAMDALRRRLVREKESLGIQAGG